MASVQKYITTDDGSLETNKLAKDATLQAIIDYQQRHETNQLSMFSDQPQSVWENVGSGAAFCEMTRTFFSSFTERQLKYYLERAAASYIDDYDRLDQFNRQLATQSKAIADHAFEISKLTESFAAGWFNKNVADMFQRERPKSENVFNDTIHSILSVHDEFTREYPVLLFGLSSYRADQGNGNLVVESKYIRGKISPSVASEGIAADITKIPNEYGVLFIVYDPDRKIVDDEIFSAAFEEKRKDCYVRIYR